MQNILNSLADQSGLIELRTAPWIPIGHSGNSQFVARLGRSAPDRVLCTVVIKGGLQQPEKGSTVGLTDMPMLVIHGEFEEISNKVIRNQWWDDFLTHFTTLRAAVPHALASGLLDRDYGHIWWSPDLSKYTCNFITKSLAARLPADDAAAKDASADAAPKLKPVAWESGWLIDPAEAHPAAPVASYTGNPTAAFWVFDEQMANDWKHFFELDKDKKTQLLAFEQDGQICPWWHGWGVQDLKFEPLPDGESFKVHAIFRDKIPETFPDGGGQPIGHGDPTLITYKVVGWAGQTQQIAPDTFAVRFDREGVSGRTTHILIGAIHPGDATYRATMCACSMDVPGQNIGAAQTITFPQIADLPASTKEVPLKATVNSPLPPRYYVSYGPALLDGNVLRITDLPDRAKLPIAIKMTAYQWGKAGAFATAKPISQVFHLTP
jgi:pimeloyl-ACP methyl ester carboxylesterase